MTYYGSITYGSVTYGLSTFPSSPDFNVFDFAYPDGSMMLSLFSFEEVDPSRDYELPYYEYSLEDDLCLFSDDEINSGFVIHTPIADGFTLQFTLKPTDLPDDFSDTSARRVFIGAYNQYGKMVGLLLSENGGIALAQTGDGAYTRIVDSDDLFDEGSDYYTFRITVNKETERANLYVTRTDLLASIGHQLRYTLTASDTPDGQLDKVFVEVVGDATYPTTVCLDAIRLSSSELIPNQRPIAIPGGDQIVNLNSFAGFDGRSSYDPDNTSVALQYWWTCIEAPDTSATIWSSGAGSTPSDASGYTNVVNGSAGSFSDVRLGDVLIVQGVSSTIMYIPDDGSYAVTVDRVYPADQGSVAWSVIKQAAWGGAWTEPTGRTVVLDEIDEGSLPGSPSTGDAYLISSGANVERIAAYNGSSWDYSSPSQGDLVYVVASYKSRRYIIDDFPAGQWEDGDPHPWEFDHWSGRTLNLGTFLPDARGKHTMTLIVNDSELNSLPTEVLLNVQETRMPFGVVPDVHWIWDIISDFWSIVDGKEKVETIWESFVQVAAGILLELWQHDYSKSLLDIQRVFQKKWLAYRTIYSEPNYIEIPATINNLQSGSGWSASPGSNEYFYETGEDLTGFTASNAFVLNGELYRIARFVGQPATGVSLRDPLPSGTHDSHWQIRPTVVSVESDFTAVTVRAGDTAVVEVVNLSDSTSQDIGVHIYAARGHVLCYDSTDLLTYLADSDSYTVRLKSVTRRSRLDIADTITGIPQLQEIIKSTLESADTPLVQNNDYFVETVTSVDSTELRIVRFVDSWFEELAGDVDGTTSVAGGVLTFGSASSDFTDLIGAVGADSRSHFILVNNKKHRLDEVASASEVLFEDASLDDAQTGLVWKLLRLVDPPEYLWAEITYIDNEPTIQANFGRLVGLEVDQLEDATEDIDYLSAVRGLWYTYWFGPTPYNLRVGAQILLGLPFAEKAGVITDITSPYDVSRSRILVQDGDNDTIFRTYYYPTILGIAEDPSTGVEYVVGDSVAQFSPLSKGVDVTDWLDDEEWWFPYVGSGDFTEIQKIHSFQVKVNAAAFSLQNLQFVLSYIARIRPPYTTSYFVVTHTLQTVEDVEEAMLHGSAVPNQSDASRGKYPEDWPVYPIPSNWDDSPLTAPTSSDGVLVHDSYGNQIPTSFTPTNSKSTPFGGMHLFDSPARISDSWSTPTKADGAAKFDERNGSGVIIHKIGDLALFDSADQKFDDADMEDVGVTNWPAVGSPKTRAKTSAEAYAGTQSLEIESSDSGEGAYQEFPSVSNEGFQFCVSGYIWMVSDQAHLRLYDHDGSVVAEKRIAFTGNRWVKFTLHAWEASAYASPLKFEAITGPVGGHFYLDNVGAYTKKMPWTQWGIGKVYAGRTGGYTVGGSPDERVLLSMHTELT